MHVPVPVMTAKGARLNLVGEGAHMQCRHSDLRSRHAASWARVGRGQAGASAVEFAIVLPVLVLLLFGVIQFGLAYNRQQGLNAAVREGARLASIGGTFQDTPVPPNTLCGAGYPPCVPGIQTRVQDSQSLFATSTVQVASCFQAPGTGGPPCTPTSGQTDTCAAVGGEITVLAMVAPNANYAISIPLFGSYQVTYTAQGTFLCEQIAP